MHTVCIFVSLCVCDGPILLVLVLYLNLNRGLAHTLHLPELCFWKCLTCNISVTWHTVYINQVINKQA